MGRSSIAAMETRGDPAFATRQPESFEILRELTRNGYVPDTSDIEIRGLLLRHSSAPDLVLHADGRIEVPVGQQRKSGAAGLVPGIRRGMSWRRTLVTIVVAATFWFLSVAFTASILEGM